MPTGNRASLVNAPARQQLREVETAGRPQPSKPALPDKPLVVIEPSRSFIAVDLGELRAYRELLYFLMWRDVKVRYKQTTLGAAWVALQPLLTMVVFSLVFGRLAGLRSDGIPYPLFAYAGLLPWTFFSGAVNKSGNSLIGNANLITKVYFPRILIPAAAVGAGLLDFAIAFLVLVLLMLYYGVAPTWGLVLLPALVVLVALLALGVGLLTSALNVKYRDVGNALPFMIQLWMFASPVIYPASMLPEEWRWLLKLNPLTGIIEGFRFALFGHRGLDWAALAISTVVTLTLLTYAAYNFRRMEKS